MFEILPTNCPCVSTSIWMTLAALVLYKLYDWYTRYTAWVAIYDKLPGKREKHWLWGQVHEHPGPGEDGIKYTLELSNQNPRIRRFWVGGFRCVVAVTDPQTVKQILKSPALIAPKPRGPGSSYIIGLEWLGEGLLIANGSRWARNRRMLTPAFHFEILQPYVHIANQCTDLFLNKVQQFADTKSSFEVMQHVGLCTLDIITRCTFSYNTDCQTQGDKHPYVQAVHRLSELWMLRSLNPLLFLDWVYFNLTSEGREFLRLCKFVHDVTEEIIHARKETLIRDGLPNKPNKVKNEGKQCLDFLDIMLTARDEDGVGMTDLEIRNEMDTFLFEGHDTTSSGISFILFSLAQNQDIQTRCRKEVDAILDGRDSDYIEWKDLGKFEYLTQCIKEGLRMYSPVFFIQRQIAEDMTIDNYHIPAWTHIAINIYNLHHNVEVWGEDHDVYKPDRFSPEKVAKMDPFAFLPFSAGQRNCIGQHFAMNEMKVTIARLIHRFRFTVKPGHVMRKRMGVVMRTEDGIWLNAESLKV